MPARKKGEMYHISVCLSKADYNLIDSIALIMNKLYPSKKTRVSRMTRAMLQDAIAAYKNAIEAAANPKLIVPSDEKKLVKNTNLLAQSYNRSLRDSRADLEQRGEL